MQETNSSIHYFQNNEAMTVTGSLAIIIKLAVSLGMLGYFLFYTPIVPGGRQALIGLSTDFKATYPLTECDSITRCLHLECSIFDANGTVWVAHISQSCITTAQLPYYIYPAYAISAISLIYFTLMQSIMISKRDSCINYKRIYLIVPAVLSSMAGAMTALSCFLFIPLREGLVTVMFVFVMFLIPLLFVAIEKPPISD